MVQHSRRLEGQVAKAGGGCIINMSSGGATRSHRGMVASDASTGGVEALTRALGLELAPFAIRVNSLVPGLIVTRPERAEPGAFTATAREPSGGSPRASAPPGGGGPRCAP